MEQELLAPCRLMASQPDHELLGRGELRGATNSTRSAYVVEESVKLRGLKLGVLRVLPVSLCEFLGQIC